MDDNNINIITNKNIKDLATEPNIKAKNKLYFSPIIKEKLHKLNFKLYKYNELNRITNKRKLLKVNEKDLFSNIIIKNYNKNKTIKNLYQLNTDSESIDYNINYIKTLNNFHTPYNSCKNTRKILPKNINRNKFYSLKKNNYLPKMTFSNYIKNNNETKNSNNKDNNEKINLCLVPIFQIYKNKFKNMKKNNYRNDLNNRFISENNSYYNKTIYTKLKIKCKKRMKKDLFESKTDENDMKPKNRFINLKKDLLEQTLKINRMFVVFNKQIKEKEKMIKFIGKFRYKKKLDNNDYF